MINLFLKYKDMFCNKSKFIIANKNVEQRANPKERSEKEQKQERLGRKKQSCWEEGGRKRDKKRRIEPLGCFKCYSIIILLRAFRHRSNDNFDKSRDIKYEQILKSKSGFDMQLTGKIRS